MPTDKQCRKLYIGARKATKLDRNQWAWLFACGAPKTNASGNVIKKENPPENSNHRKTNQAEALASELARYIYEEYGGDISAIEFGRDGKIKRIPDRQ